MSSYPVKEMSFENLTGVFHHCPIVLMHIQQKEDNLNNFESILENDFFT